MLQYYIDTAIQLSSGSAERMAELSTHVHYMNISLISDYLNRIISASKGWTDEMKFTVWDSLKSLRVRVILDNDNIEPDTKLFSLLERAISESMPKSKWYQYLRLYTEKADDYLLDHPSQSWEKRSRDQSEAILDLFTTYGIDSVISFGERVKSSDDVGRKLGAKMNHAQIVDVLDRYSHETNSLFYSAVLGSFIQANGVDALSEIGLGKYDASFRVKVLCAGPFSSETFSRIETFLPDKAMYWRNIPVIWFSPAWSQQTLEYVINALSEVGRFTAIVNTLGHLVRRFDLSDELLKSILLGAITEESLNQVDAYAACSIIEKMQQAESPDIEALAEIEYAYLPLLREPYAARPRALYYKLSNDASFFCNLMQLTYKPRHEEHKVRKLSEGVSQRLFLITHNYCVVLGVDWNGDFNAEIFHAWLEHVLHWAEETDRAAVVQHTIGNGLSYAKQENGLPNDTIMSELNKPQNREMRLGYQLGIQNQRGVHWVDPEGKPEYELAQKYHGYATIAEERGYSRVSETLKTIAENYLREAEYNKLRRDSLENED